MSRMAGFGIVHMWWALEWKQPQTPRAEYFHCGGCGNCVCGCSCSASFLHFYTVQGLCPMNTLSIVSWLFRHQLAIMTILLPTCPQANLIYVIPWQRLSFQVMLGCCGKLTFKSNHHSNCCVTWEMSTIFMQEPSLSPPAGTVYCVSLFAMSCAAFPPTLLSVSLWNSRSWEISEMKALLAIADVSHENTRTWEKFSRARPVWKMLGLKWDHSWCFVCFVFVWQCWEQNPGLICAMQSFNNRVTLPSPRTFL